MLRSRKDAPVFNRCRKFCRGVTLIELMIALVIVAILAAIALPSYQQYVRRSNRRASQSVMMDIANWQEQYFFANRSYLAMADNAAISAAGVATPSELTDNYNCVVSADNTSTPPSFTITCTRKGNQVKDGSGELTLNNTGTKAPADDW